MLAVLVAMMVLVVVGVSGTSFGDSKKVMVLMMPYPTV